MPVKADGREDKFCVDGAQQCASPGRGGRRCDGPDVSRGIRAPDRSARRARQVNNRFAVATLGAPGADLDQLIGICGRVKCSGVELRVAEGEIVSLGLAASQARSIGDTLRSNAIVVVALDSYVLLADPLDGPGPDTVALTLGRHLELAAQIGAGTVRVFMRDHTSTVGESLTDGEKLAVERIAAVAPLSASTGVSVAVESHDSHSRAARLALLMAEIDRQVRPGAAGVIWDVAHTWASGEEPAQSLALLHPWLTYVQIKDVLSRSEPSPVLAGDGTYPIEDLVLALARTTWTGWCSLEWERTWFPDLPPLEEAVAAARIWAPALTG